MSAPLVLPLLVVAVVLVVSGVAKVRDTVAVADMFTSLQVPLVPPAVGARVLPYAEIVLGAALLLTRGRLLVVAAALAVLVFLAYWVLVARALKFDPRPTCACFGRLGGHAVDGYTLARNTLLVGLSVLAVVAAVRDVDVLRGLADFTAADVLWLAFGVAIGALAWLIARGTTDPAEGYAAALDPGGEDAEYERLPIPHAVLEDWDGHQTTLRALAATKARLLVTVTTTCAACVRVGERADEWAARLGDAVQLHVVYTQRLPEDKLLAHDPALALHQPGEGVNLVLSMPYTPAAVLLGTDGLLAGGPVVGQPAIARMVDDIVAELELGAESSDSVADASPK